MNTVVVLALAIVAVILAGIGLIQSKGQAMLAWAVLLLAIAVIIDTSGIL